MSHKCKLTGISRQSGHRVSHANNKTKHAFKGNIQVKSIYVPELKKSVRLKVSTRAIRTIDKLGLEAALRKYNLSLKDLLAA
jgi:large subunit ribosomal protein L28